jgi:hypothetical protein
MTTFPPPGTADFGNAFRSVALPEVSLSLKMYTGNCKFEFTGAPLEIAMNSPNVTNIVIYQNVNPHVQAGQKSGYVVLQAEMPQKTEDVSSGAHHRLRLIPPTLAAGAATVPPSLIGGLSLAC